MIVKMEKVFVVARSGDRDRLVESLRELGRSPEEVIGLLACSLGLTRTDAPIRAEELVPNFELNEIARSSFAWDPTR